jgi:hypothetical protein
MCLIVCLALFGCSQEPAPPPAATQAAPQPPVTPAPAPAASPAVDASRNDVDAPPSISDADIPPLPITPFPAARPMEIVRAVYVFAAKHPEVLSKMPCFCGCENRGHRHNDDCFVAARDARGRPTAWEPHGVG